MAEPDRDLWTATDAAGRPLSPETRLCLLMLWSLVRSSVAAEHRDGGPLPTTVPFRLADLVVLLDQDLRSVRRHLERLRQAGWAEVAELRGDVHRYRLRGPHDRASWIQGGGAASSPIDLDHHGPPGRSPDPSVRDRGPTGQPPLTGRSGTPDRRVSPLTRSSLTIVGNALVAPSDAGGREASGPKHLLEAMEILRGAIPPGGAAPIPVTTHGAHHLAAQLAGGLDPAVARALLVDAPAIVEAGLRGAEWYSAEGLFSGERFSRWLAAQATLRQRASPALVKVDEVEPLSSAERQRCLGVLDAALGRAP